MRTSAAPAPIPALAPVDMPPEATLLLVLTSFVVAVLVGDDVDVAETDAGDVLEVALALAVVDLAAEDVLTAAPRNYHMLDQSI